MHKQKFSLPACKPLKANFNVRGSCNALDGNLLNVYVGIENKSHKLIDDGGDGYNKNGAALLWMKQFFCLYAHAKGLDSHWTHLSTLSWVMRFARQHNFFDVAEGQCDDLEGYTITLNIFKTSLVLFPQPISPSKLSAIIKHPLHHAVE